MPVLRRPVEPADVKRKDGNAQGHRSADVAVNATPWRGMCGDQLERHGQRTAAADTVEAEATRLVGCELVAIGGRGSVSLKNPRNPKGMIQINAAAKNIAWHPLTTISKG
jgi:hypothetical protein